MCPAVILAISRTERVRGRMVCLTVSIITIRGDSGIGVLIGVR